MHKMSKQLLLSLSNGEKAHIPAVDGGEHFIIIILV